MNINDIITESQHTCPHCGGSVVEYSELTEKKDACYYKVKASAKVWPSAYASGRLVQCRKKGAANYGNKSESVAEGSDKKCPPATQDITLNLKNRQKAINEYGYGPLNPDMPNTRFWMKKVDEWNLDSTEEAKQSLCGNCAAFDIRQDTLDCIAQGIDSDSPADAEGVIAAGDLGYCKFLKFKCASRRTCDAWVTGGPLTDDKPGVAENFADGKGPGRPGDSGRHGIPKNATMAELEKASRSAGRKGQLARWQLNMRRGKAKLSEIKQRLDAKCWPGTRKEGTKIKGGIRVNNCVPVSETGVKTPQLKTYAARVKLKQAGYTNIVDATVMARNPEMARRLLHQLYGGNSSVVGQPREIK
jgi:hypothetical protein